MNPPGRGDFAPILALTERMRDAACARDWCELERLESERRPLIHAFFSQPPARAGREYLCDQIRAVIALDAGIGEIVGTARSQAGSELRGFAHGRRAVRAYAAGNAA